MMMLINGIEDRRKKKNFLLTPGQDFTFICTYPRKEFSAINVPMRI
ncbi:MULTISPECIES: hypothetical protein [Methanosarcina]|jgi:hypothetical protein|nr:MULTISPECIES: hypothetical protein [Methanosarcina]MDO5839264.1 hypothetical protein [Methanosarcina mazei]MDY0247702.1 hypothetical protein [Methanosarcina mazei]NLO29408.1 hypothetical protein [Methanosarcina mazei]